MISHCARQKSLAFETRSLVMYSTALVVAVLLTSGSLVTCCSDGIDSVVAQNDADWAAIRKAAPNPGTIVPSAEGMASLFDTLRSSGTNDLVILIENSAEYTISSFYLRQRKLVEDLLRYHAYFGPAKTRLALVTFDRTPEIVYNGLNEHMVDRSYLLGDRGQWQDVIHADPSGHAHATTIVEALRKVQDLMSGSDRPEDAEQILLTFTSGNFSDPDDAAQEVEALRELNVTMYSVLSGPSSTERMLRNVATLASAADKVTSAELWMNYTWVYAVAPLVPPCMTTQPCVNNGWCYRPGEADGLPDCWCPWGYTNDTCQTEENECRFDVCGGREGACSDLVASFRCDCGDDACGCFCESEDCDDSAKMETWVIVLIAICCVVLLAVFILIVLVVLVLRKLQTTGTRGPSSSLATRHDGEEAPPRGILNQLIIFLNLHNKNSTREGVANPALEDETDMRDIPYDEAQDAASLPEGVAPPPPDQATTGRRRTPPPLPSDGGRVSPKMPETIAPAPPTGTKDEPKPTEESYEIVANPNDNRYLSLIIGPTGPVMPSEDGDQKPWSKSDTQLCKLLKDEPMTRPLVNAYAVDTEAECLNADATENKSSSGQGTAKDGYEKAMPNCKVPRPPSRLPESDLDIVFLPDHVYENLNTCEMEPWGGFVNEVIMHERLEKLCIMHRNSDQYIASDKGFILSLEQMMSLRGMVGDASKGLVFPFRDKWYSINHFTPTLFRAVHDRGMEVLCVAKSEQFLVVGVRSGVTHKSQQLCQTDVEYIVKHLP